MKLLLLLLLALLTACATAPEPVRIRPVGQWIGEGCVALGEDAGLLLVPCQVRP